MTIKADPDVLNCFMIQKFANQFVKSVSSYRVILGNFVVLVVYYTYEWISLLSLFVCQLSNHNYTLTWYCF